MIKAGARVVRVGGDSVGADVTESGEIRVDGQDSHFHVTPEPDGSCLVANGARRWRVMAASVGDRQQLFVDGEVYELRVEPAGAGRKTAQRAQAEPLTVPMPAKVVRVLVTEGQAVKRGEVLITLEAMKMELPLRAPRDGVVRLVSCKEGDLVQPGVNLLEMT